MDDVPVVSIEQPPRSDDDLPVAVYIVTLQFWYDTAGQWELQKLANRAIDPLDERLCGTR